MNVSDTLNHQINRATFWSAAIALATAVVTFLLPLDVPGGYEATTPERVAWLSANTGLFIVGWINQIVSLVAISGLFAGIAWQIAYTHPLRALLAGTLVLIATTVFFIPKFIAVWTIPMLAEAIATDSAASAMAQTLLPILNVSVPFSLYTSFDYLGFWLYSLFALLVARPLLAGPRSAKIIGITLGVFGLLFNGAVIAILAGSIERPQIEATIVSVAGLVGIATIAALFLFRETPTSAD